MQACQQQAVMRCLYGYFVGTDLEEVPQLEVPMHTVVQLTPKAYGCEVCIFAANGSIFAVVSPQLLR